MADLALEDRLQPALLDRLSDDERSIVVVELRTTRTRLDEHGIAADAIGFALRPFGLRPWRSERDAPAADDRIVLQYSGPADSATLGRVRAAPVAAGSAPVAVAQFAEVGSRAIPNLSPEAASQRVVSMRQLRESVLRDLAWLLSTSSFDSDRSVARWPEVERSVLNYGLPSVAGRGSAAFDANAAAARLARVIETYEPRLRHVRVTPEHDSGRLDRYSLVFRVEAQLWGQPAPQQLLLRTQIDIDSADVTITDNDSG